jgi:hypothetical protein
MWLSTIVTSAIAGMDDLPPTPKNTHKHHTPKVGGSNLGMSNI